MSKRWWVGVVAVLAAVVAAGLQFSGKGPWPAGALQAKSSSQDKKAEVPLEFVARELVQPALARLLAVIEFSGPLVAPNTAVVRAKAAGTLLVLDVDEGSRVKAGQSLGRIDQTELASRVVERQANLAAANVALAQAERLHASNERLAAQQFISPTALDNSRVAVDSARAQLNAAQAALDTTRTGLRDGALVAPIAGIVARRHALPGEKLSIEQQVLSIVDLAQLELAGRVGTHEVARLAPGMVVQVSVEGVAQPVAGRIVRIAPAAEPGTRAIGVTVALANPGERLRAGQYAMARAEIADDTDRLTLPLAAIGSTGGQDHVWVIEGGKLVRRAITLGRRDDRAGRVEVLQGLAPASQVLAMRFDHLREGARAQVVADRAAPVASAAASTPALR